MKLSNAFICLLGLAASASAWATSPNTTVANSVPFEVNQGWVSHYYDETLPTRWFRFGEISGHSYCVEAVQGSLSPIQLDPNLTIYTSTSGSTVLTAQGSSLSNDNGGGDPNYQLGARLCYISPVSSFGTTTVRTVKLNVPITTGSGDSGYIRLRIVDTTIIAKDSYIVSNSGTCYVYQTYAAVTNTANTSLYYQFSIPSASYVGSASSLAANSRTQFPVPAPLDCVNGSTFQGAVLIAHNGPPDAIQAYHYYFANIYGVPNAYVRAEYSMK